jgi:hypothetical protein
LAPIQLSFSRHEPLTLTRGLTIEVRGIYYIDVIPYVNQRHLNGVPGNPYPLQRSGKIRRRPTLFLFSDSF